MSEIIIREATINDLQAIYELESAVGKYPYPLVVLRQHFDLGSIIFVADAGGGHLASYVLGGYNPRTKIAHFTAIMTRPEYRETGLAAKLFKKLYESFLEFSPKEFQGVVSPDNEASLALCHKFGFSQHEIEENYYGGGEKRIVLRATLESIKLSAN